MLAFFIVFILIGVVIGFVVEIEKAFPIVIGISFLWIFVAGPFAIATFIELSIGVVIAQAIREKF